MKKFTFFLASLLVAFGAVAQTAIESSEFSTENVYRIYNQKSGEDVKAFAPNSDGSKGALTTYDENDATQEWRLIEQDGKYIFFNLSSSKYLQGVYGSNGASLTSDLNSATAYTMTIEEDETNGDWFIFNHSTNQANYLFNDGNGNLCGWTNDAGDHKFHLSYVKAFDEFESSKSAAKGTITGLAQINVIYPATTDYETRIDAAADVDAINAIVTEYKKSVDGKNVKLTNCSGDARGGRYLGYDNANSRAAAVASSGDDAIWTIKICEDGTFKLYNWVNDLYLADPETAATTTSESDALAFYFIATAENKGAVVCSNGKMVHIANHSDYKVMSYYSLTDAASLWNITAVDPIVVTHDEYNAAAAAATTLPYAIQQAYGLVTDAANYYSNYKSEQEGSYAALLDNASDSYFHSAYGSEAGDGSGVHYIQANLGDGNSVDEFYVYMVPRTQNGNNRPVNITVSGSNDNSAYTEITTITTTLDSSTSPYLSAKLGTDGTNYQYIRLTVTSTNTSTIFFTLSELYFFPATSDVTGLIDSYNAFATSSITSTDMSDAATALINAESTLALSNIKKEIAALIAANESNHAATPALGQYSTAAYEALVAANEATDATQESLEAAVTTFNASKNIPVYFISSAASATSAANYAAGKAIIYNGSAWRFETANKYNKQMWMTIPSYTEANIPSVTAYDATGTSYEICDFLTNTVMRNVSVQIVAIDGWDGAYNLQFAAGTSTSGAQHAQNGGALVEWGPASTDGNFASAWYVEYLGTSYELAQLTDEHITALSALQAAYDAKEYCADAEIGTSLGQYSGDKDAVVSALTTAEGILNSSLATQATTEVATITAATEALNNATLTINQPVDGKYYRIKGACEAELKGYYITGNTNADGGRIACAADADASTIYLYTDGKLVAYKSGLYIALNASTWTFGDESAASAITFAASTNIAGAYSILSANRYLHYTVYNGEVEVNRCSDYNNDTNHDWYLEEVTTLPVTITDAGYATFYSPVEVSYDGFEAYYTKGEVDEATGKYIQLVDFKGAIAAGEGAILKGDAGDYELTINYEGTATIEENKLEGSIAKKLISKEAVNAYYILGKDTNGTVGLYNPVNGEATDAFYNAGHKAYMLIPAAAQTVGYSFGFEWGGTTGIENIEGAVEENATEAIYDITGRQIKAITVPGIYIINGKKTFVK
ncbi:MAG: discoidin domain-containing protein [Bacteroidaceae bacterium]|nr:discoidin domain-containing protein [Bacteroidaceae bacterium]